MIIFRTFEVLQHILIFPGGISSDRCPVIVIVRTSAIINHAIYLGNQKDNDAFSCLFFYLYFLVNIATHCQENALRIILRTFVDSVRKTVRNLKLHNYLISCGAKLTIVPLTHNLVQIIRLRKDTAGSIFQNVRTYGTAAS